MLLFMYKQQNTTSTHLKTISVQSTAQDAIDNINPFKGRDPPRIHSRKATWSKLIVTSCTFISDIEFALHKEMLELQASAEGGDPFNLPPLQDKRLAVNLILMEMRQTSTNMHWLTLLQILD